MKKEARDALRNMWMEAQGGENWQRPAILEAGMKWSRTSAPPSEAQMIEARKQQRSEIAAIFGMPITMLGETGSARASAEQLALEFVNYTLRPWVVAIEQEWKVKLFEPVTIGRNAGRTFIAVFDLRNLSMPDAAAKRGYYSAARQWGFATPNEILEMESENPIPGKLGETYLAPVNMTVVDANGNVVLAGTNSANKPSSPASKPGEGVDQKKRIQNSRFKVQGLQTALWPVFRDAFGRIAARKNRDYRDFDRIFHPIIEALAALPGFIANDAAMYLRGLVTLPDCDFEPKNLEQTALAAWQGLFSVREESKVRFYLARHGETDNDAEGASDDYQPEEPLNAEGEQQAQSLAGYVRANVSDLQAIYFGEPKRHAQTAAAIQGGGQAMASLNPQGKNETDAEFKTRIVDAITDLRANAKGPAIAVTSHKAIQAWLEATAPDQAQTVGVKIPFCSLWEVDADGMGAHQIFQPGM
jgi:phosphohistidine phosphatase SixA